MNINRILIIISSILAFGLVVCFSGCSVGTQEDDWADATITDVEEYVDPDETKYDFGPLLTQIIGENMNITVPDNLVDIEGPFKDKNSIEYYNEDKTAKVVITVEKDENGLINSYGWTIDILEASAGNEFKYSFDDSMEYKIVKAEDCEEGCKGDGLCFIDVDGYEIGALSEATAHDARGEKVESYYKIEENKVIQIVSFENNPEFPITIE